MIESSYYLYLFVIIIIVIIIISVVIIIMSHSPHSLLSTSEFMHDFRDLSTSRSLHALLRYACRWGI